MAKDTKEEHPHATHGHAATHAGHAHKEADKPDSRGGGTNYVVTFPGQPPCSVVASTPEDAAEKAAKEMGVVSSERPPEVVKVEEPTPPPPESKR